jgi:hypothetical protein
MIIPQPPVWAEVSSSIELEAVPAMADVNAVFWRFPEKS